MSKTLSFKEKLFNVRKALKPLTKDAKAYNYKYADLNQILEMLDPILEKNRLLLTQPVFEGKVRTVIQDLDSDAELVSELDITIGSKPQDLGSEITYYRRYTLQPLLGMRAEDDDGAKAQSTASKKSWLNPNTEAWNKAVAALKAGTTDVNTIMKHYSISGPNKIKLQKEAGN
jgi:hypothetical protein